MGKGKEGQSYRDVSRKSCVLLYHSPNLRHANLFTEDDTSNRPIPNLVRPLLIQEHQLKLALVSLHPPVLLFLLLK